MHRRSAERAVSEEFAAADGVARSASDVELFTPREEIEHTAFLMGCDPSLGMLAAWATQRARAGRLVWIPGSSQQALDALENSTAHVAGIHLRDARSGECNREPAAKALRDGGLLVGYTRWEQGFVVRRGNPKGITDAEALTSPDVHVVNRERGAGSRTLFDQALREARSPHTQVGGYDDIATSHIAVARAVATGRADAGIGLRAVADSFGLDFVPLVAVSFDLLIPHQHLSHPAIEALLDALQSGSVRAALAALPGYDSSETGTLRGRFGSAA
jgi:molybdate-binding protein